MLSMASPYYWTRTARSLKRLKIISTLSSIFWMSLYLSWMSVMTFCMVTEVPPNIFYCSSSCAFWGSLQMSSTCCSERVLSTNLVCLLILSLSPFWKASWTCWKWLRWVFQRVVRACSLVLILRVSTDWGWVYLLSPTCCLSSLMLSSTALLLLVLFWTNWLTLARMAFSSWLVVAFK